MNMAIEFFDFDNTIFRSPVPTRSLWSKNICQYLRKEWFGFLPTLSPPYVPEAPGPEWFHQEVLQRALQSASNPEVLTVIATGRRESRGFREPISNILRSAGLGSVVDTQLHLKPNSNTTTVNFKLDLIAGFLEDLNPDSIEIWEDRPYHATKFHEFLAKLGISHRIHNVDLGEGQFSEEVEREIAGMIIP